MPDEGQGLGPRGLESALDGAGALGGAAANEAVAARASDDFAVVGLSHKSAPIAVREHLAISEDRVPAVLAELRSLPGVSEVMLISTCNRVEVFATLREPEAAARIGDHLVQLSGGRVREHLYRREGEGAVVHLFRVAASLDSMIVGEPQILGQVKDAHEQAVREQAARGELSRACQAAFNAAKRVRSETAIGAMPVSMASAAADMALKIFGALDGRAILVIGAGTMSELCARYLAPLSASVRIANRTAARAEALARDLGPKAQAIPFESLEAALVQADVVLTCTGSTSPILTPAVVAPAMKARKNRPLYLVDLAVPRDVDPRVDELPNVFTSNVDDLERMVSENVSARGEEAARAEQIVAEEVARFIRTRAARQAVPVLGELRRKAEEIARAELEKTLGQVGPLDEKGRRSIEAMSRAIVNKLLHEPTLRLRTAGEAGPEEAARLAQAAAELFGLGPVSAPAPAAPPPLPTRAAQGGS